jgi:hypothetical protein
MFGRRLTVTGSWVVGVVMGLGIWAGRGAVAAEPVKPAIAGAEGERAFADLAKFYQNEKVRPPAEQAIRDLDSADAARRARGGKYLLALLAQSFADERNGRGNWRQTPFWGGGAESDARQFRQALAEKLAAEAKAPEILDAALWLVQEDKLVENQKHGVTLLYHIQSPRSVDVFRNLLVPPHPSQAVLVAVLEEVGRRKLIPLAPQVRPLCCHYRTLVRTTARNTAKVLGIGDLPAYRPQDAFPDWLDSQLRDIAKMVEGGVPKDAKWSKFSVTCPVPNSNGKTYVESFQGWLLNDGKEHVEVLDTFARQQRLSKPQTKIEPATLEAQAKALVAVRKQPDESGADPPRGALSREGMLTGQFEPGFIGLPEALVAAWLYERGDKRLTAELIFPRIEATPDDRWLGWAVRDLLGHVYHQEMLDVFSYQRDYDRTIRLAKHLSQPIFDGYCYQDRAKQLAAQLAKRSDDFKGFRLPTPKECGELKRKLSRQQQIEYLAEKKSLVTNLTFKQIFEPYVMAGVPMFITSDSLLGGFHVLFEESILRLEMTNARHLAGVLTCNRFVEDYGAALAQVMFYDGNSYVSPNDDAPRVVDVFSSLSSGKVLEVGVARPRAIYVLYPIKGSEVLCCGAVCPYYEFVHEDRLTDAQWRSLLDSPQRPTAPNWIRSIITRDGLSPAKQSLTQGR